MQVAPPVPPTPPAPPTPGGPVVVVSRNGGVTVSGVTGGPADVLRALKARGDELREQMEGLTDRREELSEQLNDQQLDGVNRSGLQAQLTEVDGRITSVNRQIGANDEAVAQAAGIPGAVVPDPPREIRVNDGPPVAMIVACTMIVFVLFPLTLAYARRLWKRPVAAPTALTAELVERMARLEHAVDAVAVEVERIGEGQRFVTKLFAESPRAAAELPQKT